MKIQRTATIIPLLLAVALQASHFPYQVGNWWEFNYTESMGGWGGGTTDSGTIEWLISSVSVIETYPVQTEINIVQTRNLMHRSRRPTFMDTSSGYDSTYVPPRVTVDTVVLRGVGGSNGLTFDGDSCWSFVLEPSQDVSAGRVTLVPVKVYYGGDSIAAVEVNNDPCRYNLSPSDTFANLCVAPNYFSTAEGIGPVAYRMSSSPCLMDAYWYERWSLVQTNVTLSARPVASGAIKGVSGIECRAGAGMLTVELAQAQPVSLRAYLVSGRLDKSRSFENVVLGKGVHAFRFGGRGVYLVEVQGRDMRTTVRVRAGSR